MTLKSSNRGILLLILSLLWPLWAGACTLCQSYDGVIFPNITLHSQDDRLKALEIRWPFSEGLTEEILYNFDTDLDGKLSDREKRELLAVWEEELKANKFYTHLWLNGEEIATPTGTRRSFELKESSGDYHFWLEMNLPLEDGDKLEVRFFESTGALSFFFDRQSLHQESVGPWQVENNLHTFPHTLALNFTLKEGATRPGGSALIQSPQSLSDSSAAQTREVQSTREAPRAAGLSEWLSAQLEAAFKVLRGYLYALEDNPTGAAFWGLMGFSFLYGLLHAAGPGHGKTLVMTYFLSTGGGWRKAGLMAALIGAVHVFSALILTALLLFVMRVVFDAAFEESTTLLTKLSGVLIILIASHLFWRILRRRTPKVTKKSKTAKFSATPPPTHDHTCGCAACGEAGRSSDLALVLAAGIIPCPGTVTIFLFALSLGLYLTGFAAAVAMSVGMGLVIFLAAGFGSITRRFSGNLLKSSMRILELIGAGVILTLGIWLLLA
jgi:ABC-type nickel/cobalt efflux system permease component RcnA